MSDPLARAASTAPAMIGEGCSQRYDPEALSEENGAEFAEAAALWQQLQQSAPLSAAIPALPLPSKAGSTRVSDPEAVHQLLEASGLLL